MRPLRLAVTVSLVILTACAANEQLIPPPDLSRAVEPNKARVYVVRSWKAAGSAISMEIHHDSTLVGSLAAGSYFVWDQDPGRTMIFSNSSSGPEATLDVDLKPSETRYVEARIDNIVQGFHQTLVEVTPDAGRRLVGDARLAH